MSGADLRASIALARSIDADRRTDERADAVRERVTTWRWADSFSVVHRPEPWLGQRVGRAGGWRERPSEFGSTRVGFDREGRPLLAEERDRAHNRVVEVWEHGEPWTLIIDLHRTSLLLADGERVECVVWAESGGARFGIERWTWDAGSPVRGDCAEASECGWPQAVAWRAEIDVGGELVRLLHGSDRDRPIQEATRLAPGEAEPAVHAALDLATRMEPTAPYWEARVSRPEPTLRADTDLIPLLVEGLRHAVRAAVADSAVKRPFVVDVAQGERPLPGSVTIGAEAFRDRVRALVAEDGAALELLWREADTGVEQALHEFCDDETLRACREINTALARDYDDPERRRADFLDGGTIHFHIPREAPARGDWSQVIATGDSC